LPGNLVEYFKRDGIDNFPLFVYTYYSFRQPMLAWILKHAPKGSSLIELGCGSALLAILLSSMGYEVMGIDNDPRVIEIAKRDNERLGGHVKIELMDLFEAPRRIGRVFDLAYCYGVIEHFRGEKLLEAVRVHGELAKKTMFVVPTHDDPLVTDQDTYSFGQLEELCRSAGLTPIDRFGMGTGLIKWRRRLLPPAVLTRLLGRVVKCENIGVVCRSARYT